jgi:Uma2 family endonuclease
MEASVDERLRLGLEHNGIRMTPEEFDAIDDYDDYYCYELIHGVLVVSPFASIAERDPNEELGHWLREYRERHPLGASLDRTVSEEYLRTPNCRRRADRVMWTGLGRWPDPKSDAPTIAVEFVSPGRASRRRDYLEKRDEYLAIGIVEYWVIDRFRRTMTVFRKSTDGVDEQVHGETAVYSTPLLPGFELPLVRLFRIADEWKAVSEE